MAGKYRLLKQLGEGAMGVVWSAVNTATNGEVALKLILRSEMELRQRLIREAQACGAIRHRNVVQVHDVGQTESGDPFLVMELLSGETLAELLARKRRLSPAEAASVGRDVARALAAAHARGIVHRDLKPANIFLHNEPGGDAPVVKVLDFGVSKNFFHSDGLRTVAGGAVGSPMYMSPEQARAERDIDGRADVWSLGVVLYEMLTGERPFGGETAEVIAKVSSGEIPRVARRIRRIDPGFDDVVAGCLTRDREARLGPAAEVARLLEGFGTPGPREPLPSLMDVGLDPASGPAPISASAAFSPGTGRTALGTLSSPGMGRTDLRPSSSGHGSTSLSSSPGGFTGDAALASDPDDESTHRLDPAMLAPRMFAPAAPSSSTTGTSTAAAQGLDAPSPPQAVSARGGTLRMNIGLLPPPQPRETEAPWPPSAAPAAISGQAALRPITVDPTVSQTVPMTTRPKKIPLVVGAIVAAAALAAVVTVLWIRRAPSKPATEPPPPPTAAPPSAVTTMAPASTPTTVPSATPSASVEPTAPSAPAPSSTAAAAPAPASAAPAPAPVRTTPARTPTVKPPPKASAKPACADSKFIKCPK